MIKIGISVSSSHKGFSPQDGADRMVERARAARQADLDSLFVGDHHVTPFPYFQNSVILAHMLNEWGEKPFGALYLLPLWHPIILAEQIATLASLSRAPFILQCGLGDDRQGRAMGIDMKHKVGRFVSCLETMRALWQGRSVEENRFWNIKAEQIAPLPSHEVEVWIGSVVEKAIKRTAKLGDGWLASPGLTPDQANQAIKGYKRYCDLFDRKPLCAIRRDVYVGSTSAEAKKVVAPYIDKGYRGMSPDALLFGSVSEVAGQIEVLEAQGSDQVIIRNISIEQDKCIETIHRFKEVKNQLA